jgi:alkylation response protein AidB-like acyl-CoA dehydrogenase
MTMDFIYTDEQKILQSTVRRLIETTYSFDRRRAMTSSTEGWSRAHWSRFAELGLLSIPFAEDLGGLGGTITDLMLVMTELGRGLVVEPFLSTIVLCGGLLRHAGSANQKNLHIPEIIRGQSICAFAYVEPNGRYNLADVTLNATSDTSGFILNGIKLGVYSACSADWIFVTARTAGARRDRHGITVFRVPAGAAGLVRQAYRTIDGARASHLSFADVHVSQADIVGIENHGLQLVERVADEAIVALCAEAVGAMEALNKATVEYAKVRTAFGQSISKFQVIQHQLVDMKIAEEQASALTMAAGLAVDDSDKDRIRLVSAAKAKVGKASRDVAQGAVQIHGGIGITDELNVGHYMKRLMAIECSLGDTAHHLSRFASLTF